MPDARCINLDVKEHCLHRKLWCIFRPVFMIKKLRFSATRSFPCFWKKMFSYNLTGACYTSQYHIQGSPLVYRRSGIPERQRHLYKGFVLKAWRKFLVKPKSDLLFPDEIGCFQNRLDIGVTINNKYADFLFNHLQKRRNRCRKVR